MNLSTALFLAGGCRVVVGAACDSGVEGSGEREGGGDRKYINSIAEQRGQQQRSSTSIREGPLCGSAQARCQAAQDSPQDWATVSASFILSQIALCSMQWS